MRNIGNMMKQAQEMQKKMEAMQEQLADAEITGQSGGGMISITISGKGDMKNVAIDESLMSEDKEIIQDLMVVAFNDAKSKLDTYTQEETQKIMGGLNLPAGFKMPF